MADAWRVLEDPAAETAGAAGSKAKTADEAAPAGFHSSWLLLVAAIAVVAAAGIWLVVSGPSGTVVAVNGAHAPGGSPSASLVAADASASAAASSPAVSLVVEVNGAVRRPGIVHLSSGARVGDAIAAAGGYGARVDTSAVQQLNLAAKVEDGQQIHVPARGDHVAAAVGDGSAAAAEAGPRSTAAAAALTAPINVNTASAEALDTLPGIGPATAAKIIAARTDKPFSTVDELRDRKVVGAATLEKIRGLVVTD